MVTVPEKIARFYEVNDVSRFISDRPIHKGTVDKDNEFKSLWIERTTLDIACPLPGILRWFEVKQKSVQELTPVEFACETMNNVGKDIWDLIQQYRQDPKRNINPFSMRLQGVIDANVMGGISKYQEAFFSEQFLKSPQGQGQQANVQKLKGLILEKIQILDQALELHGQLAPAGVQPLHNRLLERFSQLKQSLSGLGRLKRQASESIVNTPLPPLPTEKRSVSLGINNSSGPSSMISATNYYEHDEIYTRPGDTLRPVEPIAAMNRFANNAYQTLSKENLNLCSNQETHEACPPPIPNRPRSQNFSNTLSMDGPEVPPKRNHQLPGSPGAPPLPPRGITPDKRASNPMIFNDFTSESPVSSMPRRPHSTSHQHNPKYAVVDISFDDPEADQQQQGPGSLTHSQNCPASDSSHLIPNYVTNDYRDSGISTASGHELNSFNNLSEESSTNSMSTVHHRDHCRLSSSGSIENGQFLIASTNNGLGLSANQRENSASSFDVEDLPMPPPPPIPPKSLNILGSATMHEPSSSSSTTSNEGGLSTNTLNHSNSLNHHQHHQHHHHHHSHSHNHTQQNGHNNNDGYISPKNTTPVISAISAAAATNNTAPSIDETESHQEVGNTF